MAWSLTFATLETIPAEPMASIAETRPSISPAPIGATTPDSHADSTIRCGARPSRSKSCTVSGPSSRSSDEKSGLSSRNLTVRRDVCDGRAVERLQAPLDRGVHSSEQPRVRVTQGEGVQLGAT